MELASTTEAGSGLRDFRAVYLAHYGLVWHALHRFGVAPTLVDDAVQDVFVVAYRRRASYRGPSPKPWLYGIARRVASNYRRGALRRDRRDQALPRPPRPAADDDTRETIEGLDRYLAGLRSEDRELFLLSELEGMTGPELASATGRNVQTIYTRVRKLKVELGEHVGGLERVRRERPQATARSWALLLPALRSASPATAGIATAASGWATWWGWAAGAVGAATLAIVVGVMPPADRPARGESEGARESVGAQAQASAGPGSPAVPPASETAPERRASATPSPSVPAPALRSGEASPSTSPEPSALAELRRDASRPPAPSPDPVLDATPTAPASEGLGIETELLRRAATELSSGKADAALHTTLDHARRFPRSALADLRTALRIEALCELGKAAQARGEAEAFLRERPGSPVAERIERACTTKPYESVDPGEPGP